LCGGSRNARGHSLWVRHCRRLLGENPRDRKEGCRNLGGPNSLLEVYIAEKTAANPVVAAHRCPHSSPTGSQCVNSATLFQQPARSIPRPTISRLEPTWGNPQPKGGGGEISGPLTETATRFCLPRRHFGWAGRRFENSICLIVPAGLPRRTGFREVVCRSGINSTRKAHFYAIHDEQDPQMG
jgi:hypothetical protein